MSDTVTRTAVVKSVTILANDDILYEVENYMHEPNLGPPVDPPRLPLAGIPDGDIILSTYSEIFTVKAGDPPPVTTPTEVSVIIAKVRA